MPITDVYINRHYVFFYPLDKGRRRIPFSTWKLKYSALKRTESPFQ